MVVPSAPSSCPKHSTDGMLLEEFLRLSEVPSPVRKRQQLRADAEQPILQQPNWSAKMPCSDGILDRSGASPELDEGSTPEEMDKLLREAFLEAIATCWEAFDSGCAPLLGPDHWADVATFIEAHDLDRQDGYSAGAALRDSSARVQQAVIMRRSWNRVNNVSALVWTCIQNEAPRFNLPIQARRLFALYMQPARHACSRARLDLDVERSSFQSESLEHFFRGLEAEGLISLKEGPTDLVITSIHWSHPELLPISIELTEKFWDH